METLELFFTIIFGACVGFLHYLGGLFGMGYIEINYWLFIVILPIVILLTLFLNLLNILIYVVSWITKVLFKRKL